VPRTPVDVLLVSPGTTAGWRRADAQLVALLEELGLSVAVASSDFRLARHLRRTVPLTDLAEAAAMRRATTRALRRHRPRALLFSGIQTAMLQPRRRLACAGIRFDALAADNRPGRRNRIQHLLERRALRRARALLPWGLDPARRMPARRGLSERAIALPVPVDGGGGRSETRDPIVLCYAGNPDKKGLDLIAAAWPDIDVEDRRLVVTGIEADRGRAFLRSRGVEEPPGLEWAGHLTAEAHRELLARAEIFLSASRFEDYGIAQLEAPGMGAMLVTTPSAGPYEALPLARRLEPALVARDSSPQAISLALRAALEMPPAARRAYRARAAALLEPYSEDELRRRVRDQVLPLIGLDSRGR
jgi:glycosyltransferase involved in cell wall biosynthesis